MAHTFGHDEALTRQKINRAIFEIDQETPVEDEKEFINLFVFVPVILPLHYRHPDDRIVHLAQRLVVPFVLAGIGQLLHIDQFKRSVQNVEVSLVRKILRRFVWVHDQNLTAEITEVAEKKRIWSGRYAFPDSFFAVEIIRFPTFYDDAILR